MVAPVKDFPGNREGDELGPFADAHEGHHALDVSVDGVGADAERLGDFLGGVAGRGEREDLALAVGQVRGAAPHKGSCAGPPVVASVVGPPSRGAVTSTYYANDLPFTVTEDTSGGTLVSSHQYTYDPDGNQSGDIEKLMSADNPGSDLNHTLAYSYDPQDQVTSVSTDGTVTESYTHDSQGNVTAQTIGTTKTSYDFVQGRMESATAGGSTAEYNYDPLGRLDTVTSGSQTLQSNSYDGFDNLTSTSQLNTTTGSMDTTSYKYDSLNRLTSQTTAAGTSTMSYLGTSGEVASEQDPGGQSKTYDYTPGGQRLSQNTTGGSGPTGYGYYSYNSHSDVEAVTGTSGATMATYGYTAYGDPVTSMFTGQDKNDATSSSSSTTQPYSSYRFNAMRWDGSTGQYDMGFRNYDPGLNQFDSRDMYNGALNDAGLTTDPFTGSRYAFGNGNPVSNIENDGHCMRTTATGSCPYDPPTGNRTGFGPGPTPARAPTGSTPCYSSWQGCPGYRSPPGNDPAHPTPAPNLPPMPLGCASQFCGDPLVAGLFGLTGLPNAQACANGSALDCALAAGMVLPPGKILEGLDAAGEGIRSFAATWDALRGLTRGYAFEDWYAGQLGSSWRRLAPGFKSFDFWQGATGTALSVKSMDLSLARYSSFGGIYSKATGYVDSAASFTGPVLRGGFRLGANMIQERVVSIIVPDMELSTTQYMAMYNAYMYGQSANVEVEWIVAR